MDGRAIVTRRLSAADNYREFTLKNLTKLIAGFAAILGLLLVGAPSQAGPSSDNYFVQQAQDAVGSHIGTIYWDGGTNGFSADVSIQNATHCEGHRTNAMFKLIFKDGSTALTRFTPNPFTGCKDWYSDYGATYSQSKKIAYVIPRVCHVINGATTHCHLDTITYANPNVSPS